MRIRIGATAAVIILSLGIGPSANTSVIDAAGAPEGATEPDDTPSSRTPTTGGFGPVTIEALTAGGGPDELIFLGSLPDSPAEPCGILSCDSGAAGIGDAVSLGAGAAADTESLVVTADRAFARDRLRVQEMSAGGVRGGTRANGGGPAPVAAAAGPDTPASDGRAWEDDSGNHDATAADGPVTESLGLPDVGQGEAFADSFEAGSALNTGAALAAIQSVPGPGTLVMLGAGLLALGGGLRLGGRARA